MRKANNVWVTSARSGGSTWVARTELRRGRVDRRRPVQQVLELRRRMAQARVTERREWTRIKRANADLLDMFPADEEFYGALMEREGLR